MSETTDAAEDGPCVILVRPAGPLNVGLVARACANFDASLRLVKCAADLSAVEFRMTAVHADHVVAGIQRFDTLAEAIADRDWVVGTCGAARDPKIPVLGTHELRRETTRRNATRLGLVFGNEADGLDNDELAACGAYVRIQASSKQPSLNLSHAVAVVLSGYYLDGQTLAEGTMSPMRSSAAQRHELDVLRVRWVELMRLSGYVTNSGETRLEATLDRMFRRWGLLQGDVRTMMGMLRHLRDAREWKVRVGAQHDRQDDEVST